MQSEKTKNLLDEVNETIDFIFRTCNRNGGTKKALEDKKLSREILKDKFLIGATARNIEEAKKAELLGADYIGSGAIFGTYTKDNAKKLEMGELKKIVASVKIPVFAIGGININNISLLKNIGLQGICSVSGILSEKDCKKAVDIMLKNFN